MSMRPLGDKAVWARMAAFELARGVSPDKIEANLIAKGADPLSGDVRDAMAAAVLAGKYQLYMALGDMASAADVQRQMAQNAPQGVLQLNLTVKLTPPDIPGTLPANLGEGPGEPVFRSLSLQAPVGSDPTQILALASAMAANLAGQDKYLAGGVAPTVTDLEFTSTVGA